MFSNTFLLNILLLFNLVQNWIRTFKQWAQSCTNLWILSQTIHMCSYWGCICRAKLDEVAKVLISLYRSERVWSSPCLQPVDWCYNGILVWVIYVQFWKQKMEKNNSHLWYVFSSIWIFMFMKVIKTVHNRTQAWWLRSAPLTPLHFCSLQSGRPNMPLYTGQDRKKNPSWCAETRDGSAFLVI